MAVYQIYHVVLCIFSNYELTFVCNTRSNSRMSLIFQNRESCVTMVLSSFYSKTWDMRVCHPKGIIICYLS